MMTSHDRREEIRYLVEEVGMDPADAEKALVDDDLWLLGPECRYVPDSEAGDDDVVREWERAFRFAKALCRSFADDPQTDVNMATQHLLWDMRDRAEEALRRALQR